jgi:hypothetical protein
MVQVLMYMVDTWYGTILVLGMVLMYMVDAWFGTGVGAWLMHGLV